MRHTFVVLSVFILISSASLMSVVGDSINFVDTSITMEFVENDYTSSSIVITTDNVPDLKDFQFVLKFDDLVTAGFSGDISLSIEKNLINQSPTIELILTNGTVEFALDNKTIPTGVYLHLRHVYANWTAGQPPPPDQRGLGVGAMIDISLLESILPDSFSSETEATVVAEQILNVMLDDRIDRNGDGTTETPSDGFGMLEYIYGMRDHINNAGNSGDATDEIDTLAQQINANLSGSIMDEGNYGAFLSNLNQSDADLAVLYRSALSLLESDLIQANNILITVNSLVSHRILPILRHNFNTFRNFVYGLNTVINLNIDLGTTVPTSDTSDSQLILLPQILVMIIGIRYFRNK